MSRRLSTIRSRLFGDQERAGAIALLLVSGLLLVTRYAGLDLPTIGREAFQFYLFDTIDAVRVIGTIAAMNEPISWLQPLALSSMNTPEGTTLVQIDAIPALTLLLRILYQVGGWWIDPAGLLSGVIIAALLAAPVAAAWVARSLGASWMTAAVAGSLLPWLSPLTFFADQHEHSILPWMTVAVVVAAAVGVERGRSYSRVAALAAALSWWVHPYHGAMTSGVSLITATATWRRTPWRTRLLLVIPAVISPMVMIAIGGFGELRAGGFDGVIDMAGPAAFFDANIFGLPLVANSDRMFAWGILLPIAALIGGRRLFRVAPAAGCIAVAAMVIATGATFGGGLIPDVLYEQLIPLRIFRFTDRFALLSALLLFGAAAAVVTEWITSAPLRVSNQRRAVVAILGAVLITNQISSEDGFRVTWADDARRVTYPADLSALDRELLQSHRRLRSEPSRGCAVPQNEVDRQRRGFEMHYNLLAAEEGMPSTSFQVVRAPGRDCRQPTPGIPGDLLLLLDPALETDLPCAPAPERVAPGLGIRVCSADAEAIERYVTGVRQHGGESP